MGLSTNDQILIEQRVANDGPSAGVAYLLWLFLGFLSAHRFYLGRPGTAVLQIILNICVIGLIWTLFDVFLIGGLLRARREEIRHRLTVQAIANHRDVPVAA